MPLNNAEKSQIARSFLRCFGEDAYWCGRTLRFVAVYTNQNVDLLQSLRDAASIWQPFIDSGLSIGWWCDEVERQYSLTDIA